jgi:hypothetical protein
MPEIAQIDLKPAVEVARTASTHHAPNGVRFGSYGDIQLSGSDLESIVQAVPKAIAAALNHKAYYFVPLTLGESTEAESGDIPLGEVNPDRIMIASEFSSDLGDDSVCHRNATVAGVECVFISTRLMQDRFALAFEFYINAGHHFVDAAGVPESFMNLVWAQAESGVRGETSQDAWENRARAMGSTGPEQQGMERTWGRWQNTAQTPQSRTRRIRSPQADSIQLLSTQRNAIDEKARTEYFHAAFADAIAIYLLSLTVDFDYTELREREYPLLAAPALAERLRHVAQLFPPNPGHEFSIRYRPRNN